MKNIRLKVFLLLAVFATFLFVTKEYSFADVACNPNTCSGSGSYLRVNYCVPSSGYNCVNGSVTNSLPYYCPTGGGPGSCNGTAEGVLSCGGRVFQSGSNCTCPDLSSCTSDGSACPYGGTCSCGSSGSCNANSPGGSAIYPNGCPHDNCSPREASRSCCVVSASPTPTPPPAQEYCFQCVSNSCTPYTVPAGTCSTNCAGCSTPPPTAPPGASCTVTLSPSTVNIYTDSSPYNITATVSNVSGGSVSQVEFYKSNNNINMSPVFDTGSPYQSAITPVTAGTTTLTANVYFGSSIVCSTTATVNVSVNTTSVNEGPDCSTFDVQTPSVEQGQVATYSVVLFDEARNVLTDGGFESGTTSYWPTTQQLQAWGAIMNFLPRPPGYPSVGAEGSYYARIARQNPAPAQPPAFDPHAATGWVDAGQNVVGQTYTFKFLAKSHEYYAGNPDGHIRIPGLVLQSETWSSAWWTGANPELVNYEWREFSRNLTFPNNSTTSNRLRVVLRPPENYPTPWNPNSGYNYWPVYYDSVRVYKTSEAGVNPSTVNFYYIPVSGAGSDPCVGANWTLIGQGQNQGGGVYTVNWNTTSINPRDYIVAVNAADIQGRLASGNPGNCANPSIDYRPACNGVQTVTTCAPSCGGTSCGNTNQSPGLVTGIDVTSGSNTTSQLSGNNLNLTTYPGFGKMIRWNAAPITSPGTIAQYDVWLVPRGSAPATCTGTCRNLGTTTSTSMLLPSVLPTQTDQFDIRIRARNGCGTNGSWATRQVNLVANITGNIYDAVVTPTGSNNCTIPNPAPSTINISAGFVGMSSSTGGSLATGGSPGSSYTYTAPYAPTAAWVPDFNMSLTLNLDPTPANPANAFFCSCPGSDPYSCTHTLTPVPATGQHFYVTAVDLSNGPWWQAQEGNTYGGSSYSSLVPDACGASAFCNQNLIIQNIDGDIKSAGIPLSGGTINANGFYTEYDGTNQPRSNNTQHTNIIREDYDYLVRNINLSSVQTLGATQTGIPSAGTPYEDAEVFYRDGDLTLLLNTQTIDSDTKKVIFVSGNVVIENTGAVGDQVLDVEDGSYFAIIAGGNITFANEIGHTCSYPSCSGTTTNIDGVYVASGDLILADDGLDDQPDNYFVGEGTFVGWGGISLNRSFDNTGNAFDRALNNEYPTESFIFRPDFNENTPEILRYPHLVWQEVN